MKSNINAEKARHGEKDYDTEFRIILKDGSVRYIKSFGNVFRDDKGNAIRMIGVNYDITETKETEIRLKKSEEEYRSLFENSIMGVSQTFPDGRFKRVNNAYAKMYGYENPEEMLKTVSSVAQLYASPEERKKVLKLLNEKGSMEPTEFMVRKRNGEIFYVLCGSKGNQR